MDLQITFHPDWSVGKVVKISGKNYRITKLTTTALAVERYFWFDRLIEKWMQK